MGLANDEHDGRLGEPSRPGPETSALTREEAFLVAADDAPAPAGPRTEPPGFDWRAVRGFDELERTQFLKQWLDDGTAEAVSFGEGHAVLSQAGRRRAREVRGRPHQPADVGLRLPEPSPGPRVTVERSGGYRQTILPFAPDNVVPVAASGDANEIPMPTADRPSRADLPPVTVEHTFPVPPADRRARLRRAWQRLDAFLGHNLVSTIFGGLVVVVLGGLVSVWVYRHWGTNLMDPSSSREAVLPLSSPAVGPPAGPGQRPAAAPSQPATLPLAPQPVPPQISADVPVNNGPLPGQDSRASGNFTLVPPGDGKARLVWRVTGVASPGKVTFALIRDIHGGLINFDEPAAEGMHDGSVTPYYGGDNLYVGRVGGAVAPFRLKAYPSN